jgi:Na+/H+ antiporter NhaD/arsenite permease-like protein
MPEAVTGQLFLALLLARLVSLQLAEREPRGLPWYRCRAAGLPRPMLPEQPDLMESLIPSPATLALLVFAGVILAIVFDLLDMTVAALLGLAAAILLGLTTPTTLSETANAGGGAIALLFGGMIVARVLIPTGLFEWTGVQLYRIAGGSGRRLLLGTVALVAPICALLPNATVVVLVAPAVIRAARLLGVDFVPLLILVVVTSNSAGLLTLVGDPATFIVGSSIGLGFGDYLRRFSLGGLLAVLVLVPLMPLLFRETWNRRVAAETLALPRIERPGFLVAALAVLVCMVVLFVVGDSLPRPVGPPAVAIIAASLALLVAYHARVEPIADVMRDIDWQTLIFIAAMFALVSIVVRTGALDGVYRLLSDLFGQNYRIAGLGLLGFIGIASAFVPNVPLVAAMVIMVKGYLVNVEAVPEEALGAVFTGWPDAVLPIFAGMMFGGTIGGNATLIGASSNIVAAGIAARAGQPIGFGRFLRYGIVITAAQLGVLAAYVLLVVR